MSQRQLLHSHRRFDSTSLPRVARTFQVGPCIARYQVCDNENTTADLLQDLVDQARESPIVNIPGTAAAAQSPLSPHQQRNGSTQELQSVQKDYGMKHTSRQSSMGMNKAAPLLPEQQGLQQQELATPLLQRRMRPSAMNFEAMFQMLVQWKRLYLTAYVPRFCFDAPELGCWVRHIRKQHRDGQLELWKVDRLNALEFEWELSDQDAKWHYKYHQLRRYKLLYGTTNVDPGSSSTDACDWMMIVRWLKQQARLLAKRKLSEQKRAMLAGLGVTLKLPRRLVHRTAQLQALNGMERRKLRKKWKAMDLAEAEQQQQQRQMEWEQRRQQQRQQQWVVSRRLALLRSSQIGNAGASTSIQNAARDEAQMPQQQLLQDLLLQQQQLQLSGSVDQVQKQQDLQCVATDHRQQQQQQQQQHPHSIDAMPQQWRCVSSMQKQLQSLPSERTRTADPALVEPLPSQRECHAAADLTGVVHDVQTHNSAAATPTAGTLVTEQPRGQQQSQQNSMPLLNQQQQQEQALFWQQNRRSRKARPKSRQEKWLQGQQRDQ